MTKTPEEWASGFMAGPKHALTDAFRQAMDQAREPLEKELAEIKANPAVGACCLCGAVIWRNEPRILDDMGLYHSLCGAKRNARDEGLEEAAEECAELKLRFAAGLIRALKARQA